MANVIDDLLGPKSSDGKIERIAEVQASQAKRLDEIAKAYSAMRKRLLELSEEKGPDVGDEVSRMEKKVEALREELLLSVKQQSEADTAIARLSGDVSRLLATEKKRGSQITTLAEKLDDTELHERMDRLTQKIQLFADVRETFISSINAMERRLNKLEKSSIEFERTKNELATKSTSLVDKFSKNMELTSRLHERCDNLDSRLKGLTELSNTVTKELMDIRRGEKERGELRTEIDETKSELESKKVVDDAFNERLVAVEKDIKDCKEKLMAKIEAVENAVELSTGQMARIEKIESGHAGLAEKLDSDTGEIRRKVESIDKELRTLAGKETVASSEDVMSALKELGKRTEFLQAALEEGERREGTIQKMREEFDSLAGTVSQNQHLLVSLDADDRLQRLEKHSREMSELLDELQVRSGQPGIEQKMREELDKIHETIGRMEESVVKREELEKLKPGPEIMHEIMVLRETRDLLSERLDKSIARLSAYEESAARLEESVEKLRREVESGENNSDVKKIADAVRSEVRDVLRKVEKVNAKVNASSGDIAQIEKTLNKEKTELEEVLKKIGKVDGMASKEKLAQIESDLRRISDVARKMEQDMKDMPSKKDLHDVVSLIEDLLTHVSN